MNSPQAPPDAPLSKKALKKQKKRERMEQLKIERRATRKERKKEETKKRKANPERAQMTRTSRATKKEVKERLLEAQTSGVRLVVDMSLAHLMTEKEIGSLCRQLTIVYAENKRSSHPFHLYFTSLSGTFKDAFESFNPTYHNWIVDVREESFLKVFADEKDNLVYLTADSPTDISIEATNKGEAVPFNKNAILVVGGLIDRNRHKNLCYEEASKQGIRTARLPLHLLEESNSGLSVLTTNQCVEMLLRYSERLDWKSAIRSIFPKRKMKNNPAKRNRPSPEHLGGGTEPVAEGGDVKEGSRSDGSH